MNKLNLLVFILSFLSPGITLGEGKVFKISGKTPDLTEGEMIVLRQRVGRTDTLGRGNIVNGEFLIEGKLDEPCVVLLKAAKYEGGFFFILDTDTPYEMTLYKDGRRVIQGGKIQEELNLYQSIVEKTNQETKKLKEELQQANAEKHFKTASELREKLKKTMQEAKKEVENILEKNKDNVFTAYIQTSGMARMDLNALKECYEQLSEKGRMTDQGKLVAARIAALEGVEVASMAPDFTLPDQNGKEVSLYALKGKLKIIDFWASWCGPCRMENPNMVKLHRDFKDKGLTVISVSLDEKKSPWIQAIEKDGLDWVHLSSLKGWKCDVVKLYNVDAVPCIFVLDENNRIIAKQLRGENLRTLISEKLK